MYTYMSFKKARSLSIQSSVPTQTSIDLVYFSSSESLQSGQTAKPRGPNLLGRLADLAYQRRLPCACHRFVMEHLLLLSESFVHTSFEMLQLLKQYFACIKNPECAQRATIHSAAGRHEFKCPPASCVFCIYAAFSAQFAIFAGDLLGKRATST